MTAFLDRDTIFYHGTWGNFTKFRPLSHFGTLGAAQEVLEAQDKKHEIFDVNAETNAYYDVELADQHSKVIPVKLNLCQTYEIQDWLGAADINYFKRIVLLHINHDLKLGNEIPGFYDRIFSEPFSMCDRVVIHELQKDSLYEPAQKADRLPTNQINAYHLCYQRMIQYFEHLGYDGFNYVNRCEDCGHMSYVVFRPENIARLDMGQKLTPREPLKRHKDWYLCRGMNREEESHLNVAERYSEGTMKFQKKFITSFDFQHRASAIKYAIRTREYYTKLFVNEILPQIENIGTQPKDGYHGLYTHTFQVVQYAIELAMSVGTDPLPVVLGAALHDIARIPTDNDDSDYEDDMEHAKRGAEIAHKFLKKNYGERLFPGTIDKIVYAIKYHNVNYVSAPNLIYACICDADRIRLSQEYVYDEKYFYTEYGKYLASLPPQISDKDKLSQEKYMQNQNKFLRYHGIKVH